MPSGGYRIDLHVKVLNDAVVSRAKARQLDGLVYAPHFVRLPEIQEIASRYSDDELFVVPGREIFTGSWRNRKHVLVVNPDAPIPDYISLTGLMKYLADADSAVLAPHPGFSTISLTAADILDYRDIFHGIEVFNPKHLPWHNRRAHAIQREIGLPAFASSYAHLKGTVGEVWTSFPDLNPSAEGLVSVLKAGDSRDVHRRSGPMHSGRRAGELGHLLYENTLSKVSYLVQGPKPTNPHHPAYKGRFDDAAVYPRGLFALR